MRIDRLFWRRWLWVLLLWPVLALGEPRTALVVGNAGYRDSPLNNPVNDARDLAEALRAMGFEVVQRENLDKRGFDVVVSDFARRLKERGGVGLFYYSGHGAQVKGENFLIPVNAAIASEADVEYEAVNAGRVLRNMEQAGNGLNIVVLDACRNNPYRSWYRSETKGLARMDAPTGSIVAYATAPGMVAADGTGRNSPYTAGLLQAMRTPGLGIEQLFKQVRIQVAKVTGNRQVPWESSSLMGDFFFVAPAPTQPTPPPVASASVPSPFRPSVPQEAPAEGSRPQPGQVFRDTLSDGTRGPALVVIPAGEFQMGSPADEPGHRGNEDQHSVRVARFAMGQYEVTFEEYDRFCATTGREKPGDAGWGRGQRPVINVDWRGVVAYAEWLSQQTGKQYRLPTEAEWEYAARAGTTTPFWTGRCVTTDQANYNGNYGYYGSPDCGAKTGVYRQKTQPVGSFKPNPWGLYDTMGNVWEWTCSGYDQKYGGAEQECSIEDTSGPRVLRGGSWADGPLVLRSAARDWTNPRGWNNDAGFRLARTL
ncbi:MAG: SUMF1/EgtB/PvdO family nonheme iron enzyme [Candidatus Contendobacter sp.]|nr:SUMF1/EgtB/PvdO family nonheme iron enzyme [Candidatus Contendobacter sp.]